MHYTCWYYECSHCTVDVGNHALRPPHLPAVSLHLGRGRGDLRQPGVIILGHWYSEYYYRLGSHHITSAPSYTSRDGSVQESDTRLHLCCRIVVSILSLVTIHTYHSYMPALWGSHCSNIHLQTFFFFFLVPISDNGVFSTCIASAVRLQSITNINFEDVTASSAEAYVWSTIEPGLAITLACVPLLRPLLGGNYSPTGTALKGTYRLRDPGPGTQRWGPTFRGSKNDESSSEYQLRPVGPKNDTLITAGGSRTESRDERLSGENVESFATHSIGVKKEWKVTMNDPSR